MSRTTERVRSSFYGASGTLRLTSVIMMLIVVGMLMMRSSDPRNWVWLTGEPASDKGLSTAPARPDQPMPGKVTPGPTDFDPEEREAAREQFQAITDRTLELSREEMPAYWRLFSWTEHQSIEELKQRADRSAVLNQFIQTPDQQRGKLFALDLNVRRVLSYDAPANSAGITKVYEIWGWTTESKAWLYVVLTANLPPGMPTGADVNERVTFAGYFFKVQGYHAAGSGPKDKPLSAPLLIGRVAWKPNPVVASANQGNDWIQGTILFLLVIGAIGLVIWSFFPKSAGKRTSTRNSGQHTSQAEIHDWLANAQHSAATDLSRDDPRPFHNNN